MKFLHNGLAAGPAGDGWLRLLRRSRSGHAQEASPHGARIGEVRRPPTRSSWRGVAAGLMLGIVAVSAARADAVDNLRSFLRDTASGKGQFTQTVTSADGARKKVSSGHFEFTRPNRFRFAYVRPFEQLILADGQKVWIYDPDLKQASARKLGTALDATPAALLAGGNLDKDFTLEALAAKDGLDWVLARPRQAEGTVRELRVGLRGTVPAAVEVLDHFGQRSLLQFNEFRPGAGGPPDSYGFKPPPGVDIVEQ